MDISDIKNKRFEKAAFGYKTDEVDEFVAEIMSKIKSLEQENADFENKMEILVKKIEEYRKDEDTLREVLVDAKKLSSNIKTEASTKAENILAEAKTKSEESLNKAKAESSKLVSDAKREAERILNSANKEHKEKIEKIKAQAAFEQSNLDNMQKNVSDFKAQLLAVYKEHINLINKLPEVKNNKEQEHIPSIKTDNIPLNSIGTAAPQKNSENEVKEMLKKDENAKTKTMDGKPQKNSPFPSSPLNRVTITEKEMKQGNYESKFGDLKFGNHAVKK